MRAFYSIDAVTCGSAICTSHTPHAHTQSSSTASGFQQQHSSGTHSSKHAHTAARAHARAHSGTRTRARTHTHTHTRAQTRARTAAHTHSSTAEGTHARKIERKHARTHTNNLGILQANKCMYMLAIHAACGMRVCMWHVPRAEAPTSTIKTHACCLHVSHNACHMPHVRDMPRKHLRLCACACACAHMKNAWHATLSNLYCGRSARDFLA